MNTFCLWFMIECIIVLVGLLIYIIMKIMYYRKDTKRINYVMKFIDKHKKSNDKLEECLKIIEFNKNRKDNKND